MRSCSIANSGARPGVHLELAVDVDDVGMEGRLRHVEVSGDFLVFERARLDGPAVELAIAYPFTQRYDDAASRTGVAAAWR